MSVSSYVHAFTFPSVLPGALNPGFTDISRFASHTFLYETAVSCLFFVRLHTRNTFLVGSNRSSIRIIFTQFRYSTV